MDKRASRIFVSRHSEAVFHRPSIVNKVELLAPAGSFELFISYSRKDNVPQQPGDTIGWVTALCDAILADHRRPPSPQGFTKKHKPPAWFGQTRPAAAVRPDETSL
jgi:hypothetical protein